MWGGAGPARLLCAAGRAVTLCSLLFPQEEEELVVRRGAAAGTCSCQGPSAPTNRLRGLGRGRAVRAMRSSVGRPRCGVDAEHPLKALGLGGRRRAGVFLCSAQPRVRRTP